MPVNSYYFDGHNGIEDEGNFWSNDANAFNGTIDTTGSNAASYVNSLPSTKDLFFLRGLGTTAPDTGGSITQVRLRIAGRNVAVNFQIDGTAYSDSEELGTASAENGIPPVFGAYVNLSTPTGGWTWQKLRDLEIRFYGNNFYEDLYLANASIAEIEVTHEEPTLPSKLSNIAKITNVSKIKI